MELVIIVELSTAFLEVLYSTAFYIRNKLPRSVNATDILLERGRYKLYALFG
jgi:hypothetical protein